jgi:hypothetical protein
MKKILIMLVSIFSFVFLAGFDQVKADVLTSNVSFKVVAGNLSLSSVPFLEFKSRENDDDETESISSFSISSNEKSYAAKSESKAASCLVIDDYRGAHNDNWVVYAQLEMANTPVFISFDSGASQEVLTNNSSSVVYPRKKAVTVGENKIKLTDPKLKVNKKQIRNKAQLKGTVTWTLADTASSQN